MTEQNPFIQQYATTLFPTIRKCILCETSRFPNSPHEYAYIGPKYGLRPDPQKNFKLLFMGMIPNMDLNSHEELKDGTIPSEYPNYEAFNSKLASEFREYDIYTRKFGLSSMLEYLNQYIKPDFHLTDQNIAFTNIASCYNDGGTTDEKKIEAMMDNCSTNILEELKLIQPDVVIGIYGPILEWFKWFASEEANKTISLLTQDQYHRDWKFSTINNERTHRTVKLYHPTYAAPNYAQHGDTFHVRLDLILNYLRHHFPTILI